MKRTRHINLERMKKNGRRRLLGPVTVAVAGVALAACSDMREAEVYRDMAECINENPGYSDECATAYQQALARAAETAPKYLTQQDCEEEFGTNICVPYQAATGQNWFMPAMAGFMFARMLDSDRDYGYNPMFTSYHRRSPFYGSWVSSDGYRYGSTASRKVTVDSDAFKAKPAVSRTISRGGFGSTVAAKSSWGGSGGGSKGGWGG